MFLNLLALSVVITPLVVRDILKAKGKLQNFVLSLAILCQIGVNFVLRLLFSFKPFLDVFDFSGCSSSSLGCLGHELYILAIFILGNIWLFFGFIWIKMKSLKERKRLTQSQRHLESQNSHPQQ